VVRERLRFLATFGDDAFSAKNSKMISYSATAKVLSRGTPKRG
jgi:hypothetical protein